MAALDAGEQAPAAVPDAELTREQVIARNLEVVEAHFHNETPENVEKAVAAYTDDIVWEGPGRGLVLHSTEEALAGYRDIFASLKVHSITSLRRFATEQFVFDDCIYDATYVEDRMQNFPFPPGTRVSLRLAHVFEMRDGKIAKEIAYEIIRRADDADLVNDYVPEGSAVETVDV
ncbi:nuclear transport factor 2 family protein [Pseudonocardia adelaidensis]|uniref:SnoaL-like domain-containing protein n=1 Tax=Pseudonocardia adelaidensis TaxID=648754 RepID=A0ABP9NQG7_9PSEU